MTTWNTHTGTAAWKHKVEIGDILWEPFDTYEEYRDALVDRFRQNPAILEDGDNGEELAGLLEELADTTSPEEFDYVWDSIYDLADDRKWLWIETVYNPRHRKDGEDEEEG